MMVTPSSSVIRGSGPARNSAYSPGVVDAGSPSPGAPAGLPKFPMKPEPTPIPRRSRAAAANAGTSQRLANDFLVWEKSLISSAGSDPDRMRVHRRDQSSGPTSGAFSMRTSASNRRRSAAMREQSVHASKWASTPACSAGESSPSTKGPILGAIRLHESFPEEKSWWGSTGDMLGIASATWLLLRFLQRGARVQCCGPGLPGWPLRGSLGASFGRKRGET